MDLAINQQKLYCFGGVSLNNGSGNQLETERFKSLYSGRRPFGVG